jgi:hypothetical protein
MVRDKLDPEHAMIWDKLEEIGKQPTKLIMYILPLFLTLIGALFAFSYGIDVRLNSHLEAGGKLGAELMARNIALTASLGDKYSRHMGVHHQLDEDVRSIEKWLHALELQVNYTLDEPSKVSLRPKPLAEEPYVFPYDPDGKIPAIFNE